MEVKTFILNENLNNLNKLSCHNYEPDTLKLIDDLKKRGFLLNDLVEKKGVISGPMGFHLHTYDYVDKNLPNRVKLLQISNINEFGEIINTKYDKYISEEKSKNDLKNSKVKKNDLLIAKTGEIGRIAIFKENYKANLNQALGIIRLKSTHNNLKIIPEYIHLYLNSFYAETQFNFFGGFRAGQSGLSLQEIKDIYIILPNEKEQLEIIKKINKIREEANEHYESYLEYSNLSKNKPVEILRIKLPDENQKTFIFEGDFNERLDSFFHSPFRKKLIKNIKNSNSLKLKDFLKKVRNKFKHSLTYNIIDLDSIDENLSEITSHKEIKNLKSSKTVFKTGNLLISKLGGEKGNLILIKEKYKDFLGSGELVAFELKEDKSLEDLNYIFHILRSPYLSKQIEYTLTGCSRMRINQNEMLELSIPYPENEKIKKEIIKECDELRSKAIFEKKQYGLKKKELNISFREVINKNLKNRIL